ncbi:MAG TPA: chorismate mutase [Bacillota bacterium]|nr:chorismate mutase [Bacillota bacterium]HUM56763.1 chorismate mutase [Bacillota bacterium]
MNLDELRLELDEIDAEMADLFIRRMALAAQIAEYKLTTGTPVQDSSRERKVVRRFEERTGELFAPYVPYFCKGLFDASKAFQHDYMKEKTEGKNG